MSIGWLQRTIAQAPQPLHALPEKQTSHAIGPACTICDRRVTSSFIVHGYRLYECSSCDFVFIDPAVAAALNSKALFNDAYFHGGGAGYTNYLDEAALLQAHGRRYGTLLANAGARHVLDVGAAAGFILSGMLDAGCTGVGIEPNASMAEFAVREMHLDVRATTLEQFTSNERFDGVALLQVVDHLEDVRLAFARVAALTATGGWCLVEFGNRDSLTARLFGSAWHEYAPPSVQRVFSLHAMQRLLRDYGFGLHAYGHPKKYLRADHAVSLLRYKSKAWLSDKIVDRIAGVVPAGAKLRYFGDDITWALFQRG